MLHRSLIARLLAGGGICEQDRASLESVPYSTKTFEDGEIVLRRGDRPVQCVVMSGLLSRQRVVCERNQISSFYVPADMPDLHALHLPAMDHELCSVGTSTVAFISQWHLRRLLMASPGLTNAFWRESLIHAAIYREWVDSLGSRAALPRVAHLLCELAVRFEVVGLLNGDSFHVPCTQQDLADACGLSTVHINRTIRELRRMRVLEWHHKTVSLLQRKKLEALADFRPDYLQVLKGEGLLPRGSNVARHPVTMM